MIVTIKFKLDETWDEYAGISNHLLLEDMIDRMETLKEGIEPLELKKEYEDN